MPGASSVDKMPTNILVIGAGAIGAFYASRLAVVDNVLVSVVCRSNYEAVASNGFSITSPKFGSYEFIPHKTFSSPAEARKWSKDISWDYVVVSTKALPGDHDEAEILQGLIGDNSSIVLVQNGLGVEAPYSKRFPKTTLLSAVTVTSAAQPEHGVIKHNRWTRISISPYLPHLAGQHQDKKQALSEEDEQSVARGERLVKLLQESGIKDAENYSHAGLQLLRWHKVALNAAMNPSSVLSGGTANVDMARDAELSIHLKAVMDEVLDTASKVLDTPLPSYLATPEAILKSTLKNTSGSKPSMQIDWEAGKELELEVILGNPIRLAREHGLEMPRVQTLYALLKKAQENRNINRNPKSRL